MSARVLAVDLGSRRIGFAVSDPLGLTAQGLPSLERRGDPVAQVLEVCQEWAAASIVVGLPLNMNGSRGPAAVAAEAFAADLQVRAGGAAAPGAGYPTVTLWDERLSSVSAEKVLIEAGISRQRRRRRGLVDRGAATVFLQTYLDRMRPRA